MARRLLIFHVALAFAIALGLAGWPAALHGQPGGVIEAKVDAVFSRWASRTTPGCAVGVSSGGRIAFERAYGLADLEHDVPNRPDTIFEAGSVSKQFTAAAVLLLAREGRLSFDDLARQYVPELPDYGTPITIRQLLQHTSGLRDWGSVAGIAGWPRTTRVHTHAHVLEIVSRQRALNYEPGTDWSYSNTGYNLSAVLVSRVAGEPFPEFTRKRLFEPLGMTRTSWRDDHTRVVRGRAMAYAETGDGFHLNMPFENVHGNGGLLTTVGDLLRWNENFHEPRVGGAGFVDEMQQAGRYADGRKHDYALGLYVGEYKGVREVRHSGSTAGYRAYLVRYPDQRVSVAVLCNVSSANAGRYASEVADLYLAGSLPPSPAPAPAAVSAAELEARAGLYRSVKTGEPLRLAYDAETLRVAGGGPLRVLSASRFAIDAGGTVLEFAGGNEEPSGRARVVRINGTEEIYERVAPVTLTPAELGDYAGTYTSDEVEVTFSAAVTPDGLVLKRRPDTTIALTPLYADAFAGEIGTVIFRGDLAGRVTGLSVVQGRVWDLRFARHEALSSQPAAHASPDFSALDAVALDELETTRTPGAALAIVQGDRVVYVRGYGLADVETRAPVSPDMLFRLGSTTKMFTAAAVAALAEEGKLKLDAPIGTYIPSLHGKLAALTPHQLLSHTAGLRDEAPMFGRHDESALGETVRTFTDDMFFTEPGAVYSYSNPGYWIAGYLAEAVAGKPYADLLPELIFTPVGMTRTTLRPTMAMTYPLAQGHEAPDGRPPSIIRPAANNAATWPAGSIFSNVHDLSRWIIALMNEGRLDGRQVLSPSLIAHLSAPAADVPGAGGRQYGYGLTLDRLGDVRILEHGGSRAGYGSTIRLAPERRFAVIIQANRTGSSLPRTAARGLQIGLGVPAPPSPPTAALPLGADEGRRYAGVFSQRGDDRVELSWKDGRLYWRDDTGEWPVRRVADWQFLVERPGEGDGPRFTVTLGSDGRALYLHRGTRALKRVARASGSPSP